MSGVDEGIKGRLSIKYKDAKVLAEEARETLGANATDDEIIEEACEAFEDLEEKEQASMRASATSKEPKWKQTARLQAERKEREWEEEEEKKRLRAEAEARGEKEGPGYGEMTTTTTTRTISKTSKIVKVKPEGPATQIGATGSCCVVM